MRATRLSSESQIPIRAPAVTSPYGGRCVILDNLADVTLHLAEPAPLAKLVSTSSL